MSVLQERSLPGEKELVKDFTPVPRDLAASQRINRLSLTYWQGAMMTLRKNKAAMTGLVFIILVVLVGIIGPILYPNYQKTNLLATLQAPSEKHWLGTDLLGRDTFTRLLWGTRTSLMIGFVAETINLVLGILYGGISGYVGGKVDVIMMRIIDVIVSIPQMIILILLQTVMSNGVGTLIFSLCVTGWAGLARMVRGQVMALRENEYVFAAQVLGASRWEILRRHLLPNTVGPILVNYTMSIPGAIGAEAFLSYIGLGIPVPAASWGNMLQEGANQFPGSLWLFFSPAIIFALTILAFNLFGDGLRDALDPKMRK
ncbi:MAG: ABC transporter permease [Clostridia bacterium]|nr:ABC transporter permease [Clostridia bacterium]MBQ9253065.1 ABC transporter permease [Clostridia bacterium]